jgi:hypothetical protein
VKREPYRKWARRWRRVIFSPRSSLSLLPLVIVDERVKWEFFIIRHPSPFGLYIRIPFLMLRWGSA